MYIFASATALSAGLLKIQQRIKIDHANCLNLLEANLNSSHCPATVLLMFIKRFTCFFLNMHSTEKGSHLLGKTEN